jgi:PAS domain S-box-containing protein
LNFGKERQLDPRIEKITDLVVNYSVGNFESKLEPTGQHDEIDAFITMMNMVGEELKASTISRNYFNNIFNSVSDMLFVLDNSGVILSVNRAVTEKLGYDETQLKNVEPDKVLTLGAGMFRGLRDLPEAMFPIDQETYFYSQDGKPLPVFCSSSYLFSPLKQRIGYLIICRDLSKIRKYEKSLQESEERYRRIFEESSDSLFIAHKDGVFRELNQAGFKLLKCTCGRIEGINFFALFYDEQNKERFKRMMSEKGILVDFKMRLKDIHGNELDCLVSDVMGFQGIIKDISQQRAMANLVIRTIVDTQEKERKRFAMDLHDSLGQQLSAIKFYLATLKSLTNVTDRKSSDILTKSNDALDRVLTELRNICFNLMPGTLQNFGLKHALQELCRKIEFDSLLEFELKMECGMPVFEESLEIAVFRIVQEFITNAIRHGHAKKVSIALSLECNKKGQTKLLISLEDDGEGFELRNIKSRGGMGLKNVRSRVESYNGYFKIFSSRGKGTRFEVSIPNPPPETIEINNSTKRNEKSNAK